MHIDHKQWHSLPSISWPWWWRPPVNPEWWSAWGTSTSSTSTSTRSHWSHQPLLLAWVLEEAKSGEIVDDFGWRLNRSPRGSLASHTIPRVFGTHWDPLARADMGLLLSARGGRQWYKFCWKLGFTWSAKEKYSRLSLFRSFPLPPAVRLSFSSSQWPGCPPGSPSAGWPGFGKGSPEEIFTKVGSLDSKSSLVVAKPQSCRPEKD